MVLEDSPFLGRSCSDCFKWIYDDDGKVKKLRGSDKPFPRPKGVLPPCFKCPKTAHMENPDDRVAYNAIEPEEKHWVAIEHYDRCNATRHFPVDPETGEVDPIVAYNASIIKGLRDAHRDSILRSLVMTAATTSLVR